MKLDIIVPHYREPWSVCKYLFDTLSTQRGIAFENVRVIVVNDGEDLILDPEVFRNYPFKVEYIVRPHGGVSATRNFGLDYSDADYVMFCDCDDGFLNNWGLSVVFKEMLNGFDLLVSAFVEEVVTGEEKTLGIVSHVSDPTFIHGKVYRREFLLEHDLLFDEDLTIHEDSYFNSLVYTEAIHKGKKIEIKSPFYIWRWNPQSVVRRDRKNFVLRTYEDVIRGRTRMCRQLKRRGFDDDYRMAVCVTVVDVFYDFQKPAYTNRENAEYIMKAEHAFKEYWEEFKGEFLECTNKMISDVIGGVRERACQDGMLYERFGLETWLRHIEYEVR